ncbi:MAG TPA: HEAT repeat domain-containing protein [Vicinamibacterales bacterium]|nr:HEAT repeat domain-containing protein [Vicinamibacterales bacterium]
MTLLSLALVLALSQAAAPVKDLDAAINSLGSLQFPVRSEASRVIRRAPPAQVVPALIEAAANHKDGYTRFRALVLLTGFNDPRADALMLQLLADPNDRVRAVAYGWFEHRPNPEAAAKMLAALDDEASEFVRPALTRTLAAHDAAGTRAAMTRLVTRGQDFFRSVVIEALGDHKAAYAADAIADVAKLDGPLQDDAALALGKIGDRRFLTTLAEIQRTAPREHQPAIAAAICLLGVNCEAHQKYLADALRFGIENPDYQPLLRGAANGLAVLAVAGRQSALETLVDAGLPSRDPARAAIALALGTVSLRNPMLLLEWTATRKDVKAVAELLRESFDMLEEDLEEERFYVAVRRRYWQEPDGSPLKAAAETLIRTLEF